MAVGSGEATGVSRSSGTMLSMSSGEEVRWRPEWFKIDASSTSRASSAAVRSARVSEFPREPGVQSDGPESSLPDIGRPSNDPSEPPTLGLRPTDSDSDSLVLLPADNLRSDSDPPVTWTSSSPFFDADVLWWKKREREEDRNFFVVIGLRSARRVVGRDRGGAGDGLRLEEGVGFGEEIRGWAFHSL